LASFNIKDSEKYAPVETTSSGTLSQTFEATVTKAGFVHLNWMPMGKATPSNVAETIAMVGALAAAGVFRRYARQSAK
jgi:hypothetical protein